MAVRRKVVVKGELHHSGYADHTQAMARNLGVGGWVRNHPNGDVEACFEGDENSVYALLAWCFIGPKSSKVDEIIIKNTPYRGRFKDMFIRAQNIY